MFGCRRQRNLRRFVSDYKCLSAVHGLIDGIIAAFHDGSMT